jgi:hypothetical protein
MKLSFALASIIAAFASLTVNADIEFAVEVGCNDIDFSDVSAKALAFSAKAVEVTFNSVHHDVDGKTLQQVAATGPILTLSEAGNLRGQSTESLGNWKCRNCGDDALHGASLSFSAKAPHSTVGNWVRNTRSGPHRML